MMEILAKAQRCLYSTISLLPSQFMASRKASSNEEQGSLSLPVMNDLDHAPRRDSEPSDVVGASFLSCDHYVPRLSGSKGFAETPPLFCRFPTCFSSPNTVLAPDVSVSRPMTMHSSL